MGCCSGGLLNLLDITKAAKHGEERSKEIGDDAAKILGGINEAKVQPQWHHLSIKTAPAKNINGCQK